MCVVVRTVSKRWCLCLHYWCSFTTMQTKILDGTQTDRTLGWSLGSNSFIPCCSVGLNESRPHSLHLRTHTSIWYIKVRITALQYSAPATSGCVPQEKTCINAYLFLHWLCLSHPKTDCLELVGSKSHVVSCGQDCKWRNRASFCQIKKQRIWGLGFVNVWCLLAVLLCTTLQLRSSFWCHTEPIGNVFLFLCLVQTFPNLRLLFGSLPTSNQFSAEVVVVCWFGPRCIWGWNISNDNCCGSCVYLWN